MPSSRSWRRTATAVADAPPVVAVAVAVAVDHVDTPAAVDALAVRILDARRVRPLVLLTTRAPDGGGPVDAGPEASVPFDLDTLVAEVGDVADLAIIPTGTLTMRLDGLLPDRWQVYGGAARSYPPHVLDDLDVRRSPLRFPSRGREADTSLLVRDAAQQAHAAGLYDRPPERSRIAAGEVRGFTADGSRAIVRLDDGGHATVWQELTVPPVPLEWSLARGGRVSGLLDEGSRRLALRELPVSVDALAERFPHGTVTLALVGEVTGDRAALALHPSVLLPVHRTDVSPNPLDRLDLLLAEGEVVAARVVHLSDGTLHLRLSDVDDEEPVAAPVPLVEHGQPWLVEGRPLPRPDTGGASGVDASDVAAAATLVIGTTARSAPDATDAMANLPGASPASPVESSPAVASPVAASPVAAPPGSPVVVPPPRPVPGPGMRVVLRPAESESASTAASAPGPSAPGPAAPAPEGARSALQTTQASLEVALARAAALEQRIRDLGIADSDLARQRGELAALRSFTRELQAALGEAEHTLEELRARHGESSRLLLQARRSGSRPEAGASHSKVRDRAARWADAEAWVRHEITAAWAERIAPSEQVSQPIGDYAVGEGFAESLLALDDGQFAKAMKAVVDVVTDRVADVAGRDVHRLRTGAAGSPALERRRDGATAMRCAIEQNAPSARRLHYWVLPKRAGIELARVGLHDDFTI
ncbi:hypothetical protein ACDF64_02475 [Agromyces sp. MMS24-JH15]|uniref:hypothetical protein n=1 Tax=Agromyces sp. MMS24-JH15 TaxID=3243765 RepID=UPI003749AEE6